MRGVETRVARQRRMVRRATSVLPCGAERQYASFDREREREMETNSTGRSADEHVLVAFVGDIEDDGLQPVESFVGLTKREQVSS